MTDTERGEQPWETSPRERSLTATLSGVARRLPGNLVDDTPTGRLRIYLSDHRAGAAGGRSLAERCAASNRGTPLGLFLDHSLLPALAEEIELLDAYCERRGLATSVAKQVAARAGELVGRLKLNGQLQGYSPLSRVLELEGLIGGVKAKQQLWRTLAQLDPSADVDELVRSAGEQLDDLERFRHASLASAFASDASTATYL